MLEIVGLAIDLQEKGVHVNCYFDSHLNVFDVRIYAIGWTPHIEPTIKRTINLTKKDDAILELNVISEYLNQFLKKVS